MYEVTIRTKFNTIHIAVDNMSDIEEVLAMPYVIDYTFKKVEQTNFIKLKGIEDNEQRVLRKSRGGYVNSSAMDKHRPSR